MASNVFFGSNFHGLSRSAVALAVAFALTSGGSAQAAEQLEEVVVESTYTTSDRLDTATGLGLTILETPQSVSVMTFERIADQNLRSLSDVVLNAPGISGKLRDSSRHAFSARGFAIDNYQIDGVPMEWSSGGDAGETETDTALYERIEIVRGATGLLTGAGNPSASINLVRKHADSRELTGFTTFGFGRWNQRNAMVDVSSSLALDGRVRGRAVLNYEEGDSFVDLLGNKKSVGYGVVDADITDRTLFRAGFSYQDNDPTASTWGGLPPWYADGSRTNFSRSDTIGARWTRWASTNRNYFATLRQQLNDRWEVRVDYNNARNDGELNLLYIVGSPDRATGLGLAASPYRSDTSREQYNIGLRLSGTFDLFGRTHELIAGYSYTDQSYFADSRPAVAGTVAPIGNFNNWDGSYPEPTWGPAGTAEDLDTEQSGFYAATRLSITDPLKVVAGGRLARWEQTGVSYGTAANYGDSSVFVPYAGVLYDVTETHRLYASYSEIFDPQSARDINNRQLDPLVGTAYELGLKSAFFNGGLNTTLAIFRIEQDNLAQSTGERIPGTSFFASRAAKGTTSEGFEIEVVGRPLPGWEASMSYASFTAKDAQDVAVNTDQPRKLLKLFTTYDLLDTLTIGGGLYWEGGNYMTSVNPITAAPERLEQGAFALANLMARYQLNDHVSAQLNVDNLLDKRYYSQIGFYNQLAFGEPRSYNLGVTYRF